MSEAMPTIAVAIGSPQTDDDLRRHALELEAARREGREPEYEPDPLEPVSVGGGAYLPRQWRAFYDDPGRPCIAELRYAVDDHGDVRVVGVHFSARDAETAIPFDADLRLPLRDITDGAIRAVTQVGPQAPPGARSDLEGVLGWGQPYGPTASDVIRRRHRRVLTPQLLTEVAEVVAAARADGTSTRRAVAERWRIPLNTARNWVAAARRQGYLDPSPQED